MVTEKLGLGPFKEMLKNIGGWPVVEAEKCNESKFTWMESMYQYFIELKVAPDKNVKENILYLDTQSTRAALILGKDHDSLDEYYRNMVDIAVLFGADRQKATEELRKSLDFEIELVKISISVEERMDDDKFYNQMKISDLQQLMFPRIPWQEFLNKTLNQFIRQDDIIIVTSTKYFSGLESLLSKTPKRVQVNYVIWRHVEVFSTFLTEELRKRYIINYTEGDILRPRWKDCLDISTRKFDLAINSLYFHLIRHTFNENTQNISEMVNSIKDELYKILSSNVWMDDKKRKKVMDKAKAMTHNIVHPELLNHSKLIAYYENVINSINPDFSA